MTLFQAVKKTSGRLAAWMKVKPRGTGMHCGAGARQNSA